MVKEYKTINIEPYKFNHLEHGDLEKKFRLTEKATSDARAGVPAQGSFSRSEAEEEAIAEVNNHVNNQLTSSRQWTEQVSEIINRKRSKIESNPFIEVPVDFQSKIDSMFTGQEDRIRNLRNKLDGAKNNLRVFKLDHNLHRDPVIKPFWIKFISIFIPVFLISIESYFNGTIFGNSLQGGQAEGIAFAVGISLVNVLGSFIMGMTLPWLWYKDMTYRIWGGIFLFFYMLLISYMNLLFGVFRSKLETSTQDIDSWALDNSPVQAFQIGNPFSQMADLEQNGFLFILVGLLFAIVSLLDGLFFRDIYAGYGSLGEKVLKAEKDLNNHNSVLKESLSEYYSDASTKLDDEDQNMMDDIQIWRKGVNLLQGLKISHEAFIRNASDSIQHYINQYIVINRARRQQNTEPAYWPNIGEEAEWELDESVSNFDSAYSELQGEFLEDTPAEEIRRVSQQNAEQNKKESLTQISSINSTALEKLEQLIQT